MNLTIDQLVARGWQPRSLKGIGFAVLGNNVLVNLTGVWALGEMINGVPHLPLENPTYITSMEQLEGLGG